MKKVLLSNGMSLNAVRAYSRYNVLTAVANSYRNLFAVLQVFGKEEIFKLLFGTFYDLKKAYLSKVAASTKGNQAQKDAAVAQAESFFEHLMTKNEWNDNEPSLEGYQRSEYLINSVYRGTTGEYDDTPSKIEVIKMDDNFNFSFDENALTEKFKVYVSEPTDVQRVEKLHNALKVLRDLFKEPNKRSINAVFDFPFSGGIKIKDGLTVDVIRDVVKA